MLSAANYFLDSCISFADTVQSSLILELVNCQMRKKNRERERERERGRVLGFRRRSENHFSSIKPSKTYSQRLSFYLYPENQYSFVFCQLDLQILY